MNAALGNLAPVSDPSASEQEWDGKTERRAADNQGYRRAERRDLWRLDSPYTRSLGTAGVGILEPDTGGSELLVGAESFTPFELPPLLPGLDRVRIYHGSHERNAAANELEVATMVQLGDDEAFSRREFVPYFPHSFVIETSQAVDGMEQLTGMIRITPYAAEHGLKTFRDISTLTGESHDSIQAEFLAESSCDDMEKVWDITSLAVDPAAGPVKRLEVITNMLGALNEVGFRHFEAGTVSHVVSENDPLIHRALLKMGYPMQDINGYGDMYYDLAGTGQAMTCHPAFFSIADLQQRIQAGQTSHMRRLQPVLGSFE